MSTVIRVMPLGRAQFPYIIKMAGRHYQLQQMGRWWELVDHTDDGGPEKYPVVKKWSGTKDHDKMVADAMLTVMQLIRWKKEE